MKSNSITYLACIVLLLFSYFETLAQNHLNMEQIIYQQKLNTFELRFIRSDQTSQTLWKTILINTVNKKELVLQSDSLVKNKGWKHYESTGEAPYKLYNIGGALLDGKDLYVVYSRFGVISLYKYHFIDSDKFEVSYKTLHSYFSLPSHGQMTCNAHLIKIKSQLYLSLCFGQAFFGKIKTSLYAIDANTFEIKEIEFNSNPNVICAIYVTDESKEWIDIMKKRRDEDKSQHNKERLKILNDHLTKPYYSKKLDTDNEKRDKQISQFNSLGFKLLSFWDYKESNSKNPQIISIQEKNIKQVLEFTRQKISSDFKLLDYINNTHKDPLNNMIYYFYQENGNIKIICYDKHYLIWLINDFTKKDINLKVE